MAEGYHTLALFDKVRERLARRRKELAEARMDITVYDVENILAEIEQQEWERSGG